MKLWARLIALLLAYVAIERIATTLLDEHAWLGALLIGGIVTFVLITVYSAFHHDPTKRPK